MKEYQTVSGKQKAAYTPSPLRIRRLSPSAAVIALLLT